VLVVVALGGNALLERGEKPDAVIQRHHVAQAARALAPIANEHELLICHGNGPQIGLLALESAADPDLSEPYPLDVLNGQTQGMIGYWLMQELRNAGVTRPIATVVSQTVVDATDPAFATPTKFIGPVYDEAHAERVARRRGWQMARDGGYWRRVVPSPRPLRVVEEPAARSLLAAHTVVVCGGGGGIPVVETDGGQTGVEAVVDKDATAALLAIDLGADRLLILTDVAAVMRDYGTPTQQPIPRLTLDELRRTAYPAGSMGPKIDACREFVTATGNPCAIGTLGDVAELLDGTAGTQIVADADAHARSISRSRG
jgi:carbamate kinase